MHGLGAEGGVGARTCETDTTLLAVSSLYDFMTTTKSLLVSTGLLLTMNNVSIMIITAFTRVETVFTETMFCSSNVCLLNEQNGLIYGRKKVRETSISRITRMVSRSNVKVVF